MSDVNRSSENLAPVEKLSKTEVKNKYLHIFEQLEGAIQEKQIQTIAQLLQQIPEARKLPNPFRDIYREAWRTFCYEQYRNAVYKLNKAVEKQDIDTVKQLLQQLPPSHKMPKPYKMFVKNAEQTLKKNKDARERRLVLDEIPEELRNREVKNFSVGIDQLYTPRLKKYKKRIGQAKNIIENNPSEDEKRKVQRLVEDLTIAGAPKNMEDDLRYVKEILGIK